MKCSLQILEAGYNAPGPEQFSDDFFAGVRVSNIILFILFYFTAYHKQTQQYEHIEAIFYEIS